MFRRQCWSRSIGIEYVTKYANRDAAESAGNTNDEDDEMSSVGSFGDDDDDLEDEEPAGNMEDV